MDRPIKTLTTSFAQHHVRGSRALAVRNLGTCPPLFVVPTGLADISYAFELAAHLDADIPVYAVPWPDLLPASLEALAAQMVDMIQAVQPQGPYRVLGYSSGGLLAYAIAQHLGMHDQQVSFLGLLDCDCPDRAPDPTTLEEASKRHLVERVETLLGNGTYQDASIQDAFRGLLAKADEHASLQELAEYADGNRVLHDIAAREQTSLDEFFATCRMTATFERMWPTYWVQTLAPQCPVTVFHASDPPPQDPTLGWKRLLPPSQLRSIAVPGNHVSLIETEHLPRLGQCVSAALSTSAPIMAKADYAPAFMLQSAQTRAKASVVVCVPGAGDSVTGFVELSHGLGESCHVIGMQPRGTDSVYPPLGTVELAAQHYLDALPEAANRTSAPHLIGHSFGGWVVFEMALRLHALGRPPASLTLIDTRPPNRARVAQDSPRDTIVDYFLDALQMRLHTPLNVDRRALHGLGQDDLIQSVHRLMVEHGLMPPRSRSDSVRGSMATFAHCCRTVYAPTRPYPGTLHLVLVANAEQDPVQQADDYRHLSEAWAAHAVDLRPWQGPGNHMTVLARPHSQTLAQWWISNVRDAVAPGSISVSSTRH